MKKLGFLKNADDRSADLIDDAKALGATGIGSMGVGTLSTALKNYINNEYIPQDSPIGEVFFDTSLDEIKKSNPQFKGMFVPSNPRSAKEIAPLVSSNPVVKNLLELTLSPPAYTAHKMPGVDLSKGSKDFLSGTYFDNLKRELLGATPPDKYTELVSKGIIDPANLLSEDAVKILMEEGVIAPNQLEFNQKSIDNIVKYLDIDNMTDLVVTPRNNLYSIAHELGHAQSDHAIEAVEGVGKTLSKGWKTIAGPLSSSLAGTSIYKKLTELLLPKERGFIHDTLRTALFGQSLPVALATPFVASKTLRDATKTILPFEPVEKAMDFVEENPISISALSAAPFFINEAYTSIPGAKMIRDFYTKVQAKDPEILSHIHGADVIKAMKTISPNMEMLKFLGHNMGLATVGASIPLALAAYNYFKKGEEN